MRVSKLVIWPWPGGGGGARQWPSGAGGKESGAVSGPPGPGGGRNQRYFLLPQRHVAIAWRRRRRQDMAK